MVERYNLLKHLKDWFNKSHEIEVKAFNLHTGTVEVKNFQELTISAEVLEESPKTRQVCEHGNSLAVTLQENWLTSICGNNPKGKSVNVKWLRLKDTENKCVILIEGIPQQKRKNGYVT